MSDYTLYIDSPSGLEAITELRAMVITKLPADKRVKVSCSRCGGTGRIPSYNHICEGTCFKCKGSGTMMNVISHEQKTKNMKLRETITELKLLVIIPDTLIDEFCATPEYQHVFFHKHIQEFMLSKGLASHQYDKYEIMHRINCRPNFMYE